MSSLYKHAALNVFKRKAEYVGAYNCNATPD